MRAKRPAMLRFPFKRAWWCEHSGKPWCTLSLRIDLCGRLTITRHLARIFAVLFIAAADQTQSCRADCCNCGSA